MVTIHEGVPSTMTDFDSRFDELWAIAYRVAFGVLGYREEAADVAQDTLIRLLARWSRYEDAAIGFTARVAGQRAIDVWRRRARRPAHPPATVVRTDPEERDELVTALRRLPARQRQAVILRHLADLSERDTATAMRCTGGTVNRIGLQLRRGPALLCRRLLRRPQPHGHAAIHR